MVDPTWDGVLLAGAAVFAAAAAAFTANHRMGRQLDAAANRQRRQLAHDRWIREIDDLRRLIDEAASAGLAAANAVWNVREQVAFHLEGNPSNEVYGQKRRDATRAVQRVHGYVERFEVRAGPRNEVARAMSEWQLGIEESLTALEEVPPTDFSLHDGSRMLKFSAGRYVAFMETARTHVERQVPPEAA